MRMITMMHRVLLVSDSSADVESNIKKKKRREKKGWICFDLWLKALSSAILQQSFTLKLQDNSPLVFIAARGCIRKKNGGKVGFDDVFKH